ncbi:unnamed protein product, partial [Amoebophrya sp. A120]
TFGRKYQVPEPIALKFELLLKEIPKHQPGRAFWYVRKTKQFISKTDPSVRELCGESPGTAQPDNRDERQCVPVPTAEQARKTLNFYLNRANKGRVLSVSLRFAAAEQMTARGENEQS